MSTHQVALAFEDGVTRFITCADDQTVADASYRARINIPLDCRDGACGTCKATCESGEYDGGTYIDDALTPDEAAAGMVLPCSMKPRSDLVLQIASTSAVAKTRAATYKARISRIERLSPTTMAFALETDEREHLAFLPGQYVNIEVPGTGESRSYSFSTATDDPSLGFLVKLTPGGVMSTWLAEQASVGDEVSFTGPNGSFFLREAARPLLLIAGGTGLAPILSILRTLRESGSTRPAHLVYGVSTDDDLVELAELEELATAIPGLTWDHCVSDPDTTAARQGYVMGLIRPEHLYGGDVAVYLCGPPPMVEAVRAHFAEQGVEPTGFYYEKFALSGPAPAGADGGSGATSAPAPEATEAPVEIVSEPDTPAAGAPPTVHLVPEAAGAPLEEGAGRAGRTVAGQELFPVRELVGLGGGVSADPVAVAATARTLAGRQVFPSRDVAALVQPRAAVPSEDGYEIGEEHPSVHASDAIFEARMALELGALDLVLGRISSRQVAGYRLLAEACVPYVDGDRFVDAAAYTETNAAFHDYLFTLTGNEHLLRAYQALGVKGRMEDVLRTATWCHPRCAQDHLDIVEAVERGDRTAARELVTAHADRSKTTMRRAMDHDRTAERPRFTTPGRFAGKVVVVTGAAQGIGEAVARRISAENGQLMLADRSDLVHQLADELAASGQGALAVVADLEAYAGAARVVEHAVARFGRIDVLINNVGGAINFKPFTEFTEAEIEAEVQRSLMTTLFACRAALPEMVRCGSGVIVNVSSAATRGIHRIPYSAAKGGVNAITASLALEYADDGIRVVATAPGGTEAPPRKISRGTPVPQDDLEQQWFQAHIDQTLSHSLMHRYGSLDEQAAAITFLASEEASYITGTVLPVAGGDLG
ncbi:benzoate 1,2-dioxygenase electron transfer component BenC [Nocardioides ganghwensis]|uniref:1,6-dihydroxycyclohexa-2,4-diene-1-carboxylate dehydrogenase n=1 Tax=Nocardioides ganghwensis TaxID=252230 RepID=A0A4Q2SB32_9ACTN|nr:benzoate 1,2-dioxygenase electron transfer component BenC [Nocardioides ganghwensis]MBD3947809.1 1,6-dihydroxycyclohexa-2,4-diene-1-carboxylate dehydrogenase [Nocardioides ganghwensis]RYB98133.1 1,6-dihydroxycyclohexa-2,4-diene-1-carboxylate dehydrogenase [Nocardioides ganghwensis]